MGRAELVAHPAHSAKRIQIVRQAKLYHWRTNPVALAPVGALGRAATARSLGSSGFQRFFPDPYEVPVKSRTRLSRLMTKPGLFCCAPA